MWRSLFGLWLALCMVCASTWAEPHVIEVSGRLLSPEDGLLLGNGDLSVSVYQTAARIVWRFGKNDVWDRRHDLSDDPKPAHIREIARGILHEGWKCYPYGFPTEKIPGSKRMRELCHGGPPSNHSRPYPCPKPVGELAMQLPADQRGLRIEQRLSIEDATLRIVCSWRSGVRLTVECFIPPKPNVLVVRWRIENWNDSTLTGRNTPPIWFSLYRWPDPPIREFAERFAAQYRHNGFRAMASPKATPLPPPTVQRDEGYAFIEQTFPPDPLFKSGFRYAIFPFAPGADLRVIDMRATREARVHMIPRLRDRSGRLVVAVTSSSDAGGPVAEMRRVRKMVRNRIDQAIAELAQRNRAAAAAFWSKSSVRVADRLIENLWYETLHIRRCVYRPDTPPPGLFLPSTVRDYSHWHGDYHMNYNYQEPFWGNYTANHLALGDAYFSGMKFMLPIGRKIARDYYGCRGVYIQLIGFPIEAQDDPLGTFIGRMAYMTGWAQAHYWRRYLYTLDKEWLRTQGYPVIRDAALFYLDFLKKGDDGLYHAFPSPLGEDWHTSDPKRYTDRAEVMRHVRYSFHCAIRASEVLGVDTALRAQWRERLDHLAGEEGKPPRKLKGIEKLCRDLCAPEFGFGRPYRPQPEKHSGKPLPPKPTVWYFGQYPWFAMMWLRAGGFIADRDFPLFRQIVETWRHPNGLCWGMAVANYGHAGAWTESLGVIAPLQEMMLQSWDGALRIFPAWPRKLDASFTTFRAEGAFLVSASWSNGRVGKAEILSEKGGPCRVYSPWPGGLRVLDARGREVEVRRDPYGRPEFQTVAGEKYILTETKP